MDDCIFCSLVQGNIPSQKVFASENLLAFLDIAPVQPGHTVLIPKEHYPSLADIPESLGGEILAAQKEITSAILQGLNADGVNLCMNINEAAGQLVFHAHFHLIPRFKDDSLKLWEQGEYESKTAMTKVAESIRTKIRKQI